MVKATDLPTKRNIFGGKMKSDKPKSEAKKTPPKATDLPAKRNMFGGKMNSEEQRAAAKKRTAAREKSAAAKKTSKAKKATPKASSAKKAKIKTYGQQVRSGERKKKEAPKKSTYKSPLSRWLSGKSKPKAGSTRKSRRGR